MIKKNQNTFNLINQCLDIAIIYVTYFVAVYVWIFIFNRDESNISVRFAMDNSLPVFAYAVLASVILKYGGLYKSFRFQSNKKELFYLAKYWAISVAFGIALVFIMKVRDFSRGVVVVYGVGCYAVLSLKRIVARAVLRYMRANGLNRKYVLIVGDGELAEKFIENIGKNPQLGLCAIGYVGAKDNKKLGKRLGNYSELDGALEEHNPDEIVIALEQYEQALISNVICSCEKQGIRSSIIPIYNSFIPENAAIDVLGSVRLICLRANALEITFNRLMKRCFDVCFSAAAILLSSPVLIFIAIGVRFSGPGPILFRQVRVGKDRKPFTMLKFRSMNVNNTSDTAWSKKTDKRVTPFGAFIRKFSLDELPQFFNVLMGDMSVVGPRPELPHFVEQYKETVPKYMVKHQVKPGLTGWAQINGYRGDTSIEKRIEHDIWYIENWSMLLDIRIILKTVFGGMMNEEKNMGKKHQEQPV